MLFFDNLFDSVNGSYDNSKKRSAKPLLGPLTPKSPHQKVWTESKKILKSMMFIKQTGKAVKIPSLNNWIRTIDNFEYLKSKLFSGYDLKSVWLRHFNQDPLENFFGSIRSHGYRNNNPTCAGFEVAFAALLINNLSSNHSPGANCEKDSATAFKSLKRLFFEKKDRPLGCAHCEVEYNHVFNENIITGLENKTDPRIKAELEYVTGYILRKTKAHVFKNCHQCKENMYGKETDCSYIKIREHIGNKKYLTYPSLQLMNCFSDIQDVVTFILKDTCEKQEIKNYLKTVLRIYLDFNFLKCPQHKIACEEFILDLSCRFFLFNWCRDLNKILNGSRVGNEEDGGAKKLAMGYMEKRRK